MTNEILEKQVARYFAVVKAHLAAGLPIEDLPQPPNDDVGLRMAHALLEVVAMARGLAGQADDPFSPPDSFAGLTSFPQVDSSHSAPETGEES